MHSPDVPNLETWRPTSDGFAILVQLMVGPEAGEGEESFDVTVCSPPWLAEQAQLEPVIDLQHHVLVETYNYTAIERHFKRLVGQCSGSSWTEVATQVARIGHWEFQDYQG